MKKTIIANKKTGIRVDLWLTQILPQNSRSYFLKLIKDKMVQVNNKTVKPSYLIQKGDQVDINLIKTNNKIITLKPNKIDLDLVYEDNNVLVINKPPFMVVHPSVGHNSNTLVNALIHYYPNIKKALLDSSNPISKLRPGIVHRLDKDTSGLIIVAKNQLSIKDLAKKIKSRQINKTYLGICVGMPKKLEGELVNFIGRNKKNRQIYSVVNPLQGKKAILKYQVLNLYQGQNNQTVSLIKFNLVTGRTHQIRAQMKHLGYPILGDKTYTNKSNQRLTKIYKVKRQMLHASDLSFCLPKSDKISNFNAKMPHDFKLILDQFELI